MQRIYSRKTLLGETLKRASAITSFDRIFIGTNASLKKSILEGEPNFPKENFIIEPEGKNTAPIIALASLYFQKKFGDPIQVVLSADAFISPLREFTKTIHLAIRESGRNIILLGVRPSRPETGYGYIQVGRKSSEQNAFLVKKFVEKPEYKKALQYIKNSNYYWNPGIFVWRTSVILNELETWAPEVFYPIRERFPFKNIGDLSRAFQIIESIPIDTAVMEKSKNIKMIPATFQWDDVGSWISLARILPDRGQDNYHQGKEVIHYNSSGVISSVSKELTAFLGVKDLVVIEEEDVLFVASKSGLSQVKSMLSFMRKNPSLQKYLD